MRQLILGILLYFSAVTDLLGQSRFSVDVAFQFDGFSYILSDKQPILKEDLIRANVIKIITSDPDLNLSLAVIEFKLSTIVNDSLIEAISNNEKLTNEQKGIISKAIPGSKIYMEDIRVRDDKGSTHLLTPKVLYVR